jgi:hypothetical protein
MTNTGNILSKGDTLTSLKDGCVYTITQVRVNSKGELLSYFAVDSLYNGIVVHYQNMERWDYRKN